MNAISIIMLVFTAVGALDYLTGNHLRIGKEFERGILMIGTMILSMVGMLVLAPLIAHMIAPVLAVMADKLPFFEPSVIAGSLLANDMGGAPLATKLAIEGNEKIGQFNAFVVSSMLGCMISFTIPFASGVVDKKFHNDMFLGFVCGIATIPVGCIVGGMMCGHCEAHVKEALEAVHGVQSATADHKSGTVLVRLSAPTALADLRAAVQAAGYTVE